PRPPPPPLRGVGPAEPGEVAPSGGPSLRIGEVLAAAVDLPPQHRMIGTQLEKLARHVRQVLPVVLSVPVHPGDRRVLAIGVVVALLSAPELVSSGDHRDAG